MNDNRFDIIIIGAGPAGIKCAEILSEKGKKVCLIEKNKFGGTCVNYGCIPTKYLINTCNLINDIKRSNRFGVKTENLNIDFIKIFESARNITSQLSNSIYNKLKSNKNITLVNDEAKILDTNLVYLLNNEESIYSDYIIIASGAKEDRELPYLFKLEEYYTYKDIFKLTEKPNIMRILGGGTMASEFAYIFQTLGVNVELYTRSGLLSKLPDELTTIIKNSFSRLGIKEYYILDYGIYDEKPLLCAGVTPQRLISNISLNYNVDNLFRTNFDNIYCIGDVTSTDKYAYVAEYQAEFVVNDILGIRNNYEQPLIPFCIYTNPQIAGVGKITKDYIIKDFSNLPVSICNGDRTGKMIEYFEQGKLVGVYICHRHADHLIPYACNIIRNNYLFLHPSITEIFK